ncbi:hypothetical protein B9Q01_02095 [Candidatus Marsarchaeota G1 archaeon OSP_D]|jgi:glycine hydroxymethyltransferase|uniref:Serine hydroxymethyltransferase-like domain-containing protein n=3 Tax=Candidatus Marsarchaeota group 1 TaxID=2203770 RepID=A0A2R6AJU5_9ARCH|nr:MAG: hypothetical protein B9Q01_02095 [Candidatus Marsarchaeota G1 archaeon OSP_D]PSN86637.1 MAG: hypothetical protein B9Q02_01355 [Candidatus Marsarchaeota G1 archaeon BE_D]PSN89098.1 MAG: hypothetical protein B9Q00_02915 [Candidatus Marsarchaeota G1 archaeon OSP_C]
MVSQTLELSALELVERAKKVVSLQNKWRGSETINLIASENVMSEEATRLYVSDFMHRYAEGEVGDRYYEGVKFADEIEDLCERALKKLFGAEYVNVKPISGAQANLAVFYAFTKPGDVVMSFDLPSGGHISYREFGAAGCRGLSVVDIPYKPDSFEVDYEAFANKLKEIKDKLKLITLGGSLFLFPHPVKEISKIVGEELPDQSVIIHYDAAHVLGLIAGGQFQQPFKEGAKVVSSSTHKTFPGPQGGLVMGVSLTDKQISSLRKAVFPGLVSNHHLHRLPALLYVTAEMMTFGQSYAKQIVSNAKALAKALDENGFRVLAKEKGYTQSHQVAVNVSELGGGAPVSQKLAQANIITNKNLLPGENPRASRTPSGIRLGVQEVTRYGMKEKEMERIAELFRKLLIEKADVEKVANEVKVLRQEFQQIQYTF